MSDQPMPSVGRVAVTPVARRDFVNLLRQREARGIETYGRSLETWNGRDALQDAAEEAIDLWQYLTQASIERCDLMDMLTDALPVIAMSTHPDATVLGADIRQLLGIGRADAPDDDGVQ